MNISIDNALGAMPHALSLRAERTSVLANNIANADTPGFKARDFDFHQVLQQRQIQAEESSQGSVKRTNANHLAIGAGGSSTDLQYRNPLMASLDGNSVDTQLEQAAFAENSTQFLTALRLLNGRITGLMSAIKGE
ncbi:MAG: flagellar basal body rod protein FlgB [Pseudomonadales bacterium]|nr:flagellar basal body rod protein FlgB [Pseudomonadales bacterium]